MTNGEILKAAIEQCCFDWYGWGVKNGLMELEGIGRVDLDVFVKGGIIGSGYLSLLFDNDFAKKFWGEDLLCYECSGKVSGPGMDLKCEKCGTKVDGRECLPAYRHHMSIMAIQPNNGRLFYIQQFLL